MHLRLGMTIMASPLSISKDPTTLRYHFEAIFMSKSVVRGNTLAYLTYSFRWKVTVIVQLLIEIKRK